MDDERNTCWFFFHYIATVLAGLRSSALEMRSRSPLALLGRVTPSLPPPHQFCRVTAVDSRIPLSTIAPCTYSRLFGRVSWGLFGQSKSLRQSLTDSPRFTVTPAGAMADV